MICLMCNDIWEARDLEELLESGEEYIAKNGKFICPLCLPYFKQKPLEKQVEVLTTEPNYPLTLEELREMDGEPVWWWNTTQKPSCTICVSKKYMPEPTFVTYDFAKEDERKIVKYSRMKKWGYKPYRRMPEEGKA